MKSSFEIDKMAEKVAHLVFCKSKRLESDSGGAGGAFIGKGKLTEYKKKDDSWILHQMDKGVDKGIDLKRGKGGQWEIDGYKKREKLIAKKICGI